MARRRDLTAPFVARVLATPPSRVWHPERAELVGTGMLSAQPYPLDVALPHRVGAGHLVALESEPGLGQQLARSPGQEDDRASPLADLDDACHEAAGGDRLRHLFASARRPPGEFRSTR